MRRALFMAVELAAAAAVAETLDRSAEATVEAPAPLAPAPAAFPAPPQAAPPPPSAPRPPTPVAAPPAVPPYPWYPQQPPPYPGYPPYPPPYQVYPQPQPPPMPQADAMPPRETAAVMSAPPELPRTGPFPSRASWSLQLESAQGVATGEFGNALLAGHIDYAFASRLKLGGYLAIANLKGKDRRVSALLPCALVTYEKPPAPGHSLSIPIQLATGYLTQNGPVARLSAGLAWAVGQRTDLIFTAGPMVWVTRDDMLLSVDVAVELRFRAVRNSETPRPP